MEKARGSWGGDTHLVRAWWRDVAGVTEKVTFKLAMKVK
jgi:hypothetical protein